MCALENCRHHSPRVMRNRLDSGKAASLMHMVQVLVDIASVGICGRSKDKYPTDDLVTVTYCIYVLAVTCIITKMVALAQPPSISLSSLVMNLEAIWCHSSSLLRSLI